MVFSNSHGSYLHYKRKDSQKQVWCIRKFFPEFTFQVVYMYFRDLFAAYLTVKKLGVGRLNCSLV